MFRRKVSILQLAISALILSVTLLPAQNDSVFDHFIEAKDGKLYDGEQTLRFISFNIPNLLSIEDNMAFTNAHAWRQPDSFEIADALRCIKQMGGKVARTYVITVRRQDDHPDIPRYVEGPGQFNEESFRTLDQVLALANRIGVRLIIPFMDNWKWMGGRPQYAAFRGKDKDAFWSDAQLREDYKATLHYILNRRNTITGIDYKNDKAIMAWELGNEIREASGDWIKEMAAFIRSIDNNHLINDGRQSSDLKDDVINDPNIDILSTHHYEQNPADMLKHIKTAMALAKTANKPYYIGEFGFISTSGMEAILKTIIKQPSVAGALIWSLRFHNRDGGFYWHSEPLGGGLYKAYHWPGFDSGEAYDERGVLKVMHRFAYAIDGKKTPALKIPAPPKLLPVEQVGKISWQGSVGASSYTVERSDSKSGPWQTVGRQISDAAVAYAPLFNDESAEWGKAYFYRIKAVNYAGISTASNIAGPVKTEKKMLVDEMANYAMLFHRSGDLFLDQTSTRAYKEDFHRLAGKAGAELIYYIPGSIAGFKIFTFSENSKNKLQLAVASKYGRFEGLTAEMKDFFSGEKDYNYLRPVLYEGKVGDAEKQFLKIKLLDSCQIGRIEIEYGR